MPVSVESIRAYAHDVALITPQGGRRRHEDAMRSAGPDVSTGTAETRRHPS
jgi:hypothetical protein